MHRRKFLSTTGVLGAAALISGDGVRAHEHQAHAHSNAATVFIACDAGDKREDPRLSQMVIIGGLRGQFAQIKEATIFGFPPQSIPGLGVRSDCWARSPPSPCAGWTTTSTRRSAWC